MQRAPTATDAGSSVQETQFAATASESEDLDTSPRVPDASVKHYGHVSSPGSQGEINYGSANGTNDGSNRENGFSAKETPQATLSPRALGPDLLRGLLMILQAIDHCSVSQGAWRHGVALESEADGTVVTDWNDPVPWTARMLTHLCAPGFMFLLGMGVTYFAKSRSKLGWSPWQMTRHFAIRAIVLMALNEVFFTLPFGRGRVAIINIILFALAINYFLVGLLWLGVSASEKRLSRLLEHSLRSSGDAKPLIPTESDRSTPSVKARALAISWHIHNSFLFILTIITIAWNNWLSPHHGRCPETTAEFSGPTEPRGSAFGPWYDFWFLSLSTKLVVSPFPPLAWLSPAILGLLYGRVVLSRGWKPSSINASNAMMGVLLMILFILTRLFHFGNLSEDCLHMPEQVSSLHQNQYLASFRSFFYITKYPPSFSYIAFTMSVNFLLLSFFGTLPEKIATRIPALLTFGQSALFFYIVHLILYFALGSLAKEWFGHYLGYTNPFDGEPAVGTHGRPAVMWCTLVLGLVILWPLCRWYGRLKRSKGPNSVWRFF